MNTDLRRKELAAMKVAELKALAAEYGFKVSGKKANIIEEILNIEEELNDEESQAGQDETPEWWYLVCEMNTSKDGAKVAYAHVADRPLLQQILLHVCRDLYLDSQRAVKAANGDKSVKQFGPVFVSKKHNGLRMKDTMAKATVKAAAEKILTKEQQKKLFVLNQESKHVEFKQAVQILDKLNSAGLIYGEATDKEYAKFYSVYPDELMAFLKAVGCLKK